MYSLLSAGVLAADLARHPDGAQVADTVDRVLALAPDAAAVLADVRPAPPAARDAVLAAARATPRVGPALHEVRGVLGSGGGVRAAVDSLEAALLGGLDDLLAVLAAEPPLAGRPGAQVALDAVAAAWAGTTGGPETAEAAAVLRRPWDAVAPVVPPPLPEDGYGTGLTGLRDLLEAVDRRDLGAWERVAGARGAARGRLVWSDAMHLACRVAVGSGRVRSTARAQLAGARALRRSVVSTTPWARAAAMAVTAAVQATCVSDRLDPTTTATLLGPWRAGAAGAGGTPS